jgi:hypothetical protein
VKKDLILKKGGIVLKSSIPHDLQKKRFIPFALNEYNETNKVEIVIVN